MVIVWDYGRAGKNIQINIATNLRKKRWSRKVNWWWNSNCIRWNSTWSKNKNIREDIGEMSHILLQTVLNRDGNSRRIDSVIDVYLDHSFKNAKKTRRGSRTRLFQNLNPMQPIKQWNQFLSSSQNKKELVKFIVNHWKQKTPFMVTNIFTLVMK